MAIFLNTSKAYAEVEDLTSKVRKELVLISPFVKFPDQFFQRLKDVDKRNIKTTIVCREEKLTPDTMKDLRKLSNLELRFLKNLHAKCFYNEFFMVITSLNLYEYSQQNNREMGVLITLKEDHDLYVDALCEANYIIRSATYFKPSLIKDVMQGVDRALNQDLGKLFITTKVENNGHCIRCGRLIPLNTNKPYCSNCLNQWESEGKRYDFKEQYCNTCGEESTVSYARPQCHSCFSRPNTHLKKMAHVTLVHK